MNQTYQQCHEIFSDCSTVVISLWVWRDVDFYQVDPENSNVDFFSQSGPGGKVVRQEVRPFLRQYGKRWDRRSVRFCGSMAKGETVGPSVFAAVWQKVRQEVRPFLRQYGKRWDRKSVLCRGSMTNGDTGGPSGFMANSESGVPSGVAAVWQTVSPEVRPVSRQYSKRWVRRSVRFCGGMANPLNQ